MTPSAGGISDRLGRRAPLLVTALGVAAFAPTEIRAGYPRNLS